MVVRQTPAGYSRTLHMHVKEVHAELRAMGYPKDIIYVLLMDVMMRLAFEETGDVGVADMVAMVTGAVRDFSS